jgi:hypothetical protein
MQLRRFAEALYENGAHLLMLTGGFGGHFLLRALGGTI